MKFKWFIRQCLTEVFGDTLTRTPTPSPPKGRHWGMGSKRTLDLTGDGDDSPTATSDTTTPPLKKVKPYSGPNGERKRAPSGLGCPGGELTPTALGSGKRRKQKKCKYCLHARGVRKDTTWLCSGCCQPVCLGCIYRYHVWVNENDVDC